MHLSHHSRWAGWVFAGLIACSKPGATEKQPEDERTMQTAEAADRAHVDAATRSATMANKKTLRGRTEVKTYQPVVYDEPREGPKLTEVELTETFTGGIEAESRARALQAQRGDGSVNQCAIQRVVGVLDGRRGSFVLQSAGTVEAKHAKSTWFVVPGSGTGDLRGLRGEGGFEAELGQHGSWTLDYWFE